jgi:hypothetical protein
MSAARTAPRTRPTTVGWIAIIIFVFLAGLGTVAALAAVAVFNSVKSHESQVRNPKVKLVSDPAKVRIPAYQDKEFAGEYYPVARPAGHDENAKH